MVRQLFLKEFPYPDFSRLEIIENKVSQFYTAPTTAIQAMKI
jgi:hypothetical protein